MGLPRASGGASAALKGGSARCAALPNRSEHGHWPRQKLDEWLTSEPEGRKSLPMNSTVTAFVLPFLLAVAAGCGGATETPASPETMSPPAADAAPGDAAPTADAPAAEPAAAKDIVDTAVGAGSFKTLVAAVTAAGLVDTLKGAGPFTVFAPTDEAFAKLPKGTVEDLLKPENKEKLKKVLTYHVVPGKVTAEQAMKTSSAKTVQGSDLQLKTEGGSVMVNGAKVTQADIACSNGVIHVIDAVVLPK